MKVMLVNGSPHASGSTYTALCEIANALEKQGVGHEIYHIGNKAISGCIGCGQCYKLGKCAIDDSVNEFAQKAIDFDGFIFGTPVYYASANGSLTSFMDRLFYSHSGGFNDKAKYFRGKPAATIAICRRGGSSATFDQLNKYYTISEMPVVSSQYWNSVHAGGPEDIKHDLEGLQTMRTLANNMAWLLKCIDAGKKAGIEMPAREEPIWTNFIR